MRQSLADLVSISYLWTVPVSRQRRLLFACPTFTHCITWTARKHWIIAYLRKPSLPWCRYVNYYKKWNLLAVSIIKWHGVKFAIRLQRRFYSHYICWDAVRISHSGIVCSENSSWACTPLHRGVHFDLEPFFIRIVYRIGLRQAVHTYVNLLNF